VKPLSELVNNQVVDGSGRPVGTVDELILDCDSGRILQVVVVCPDQSRFCRPWGDLKVTRHGFELKSAQ
jgi:sporulation protein YlmC with PRC-barrel domain